MGKIGEHAVVIGASVGGLSAASALAEFYEQVTVVDRDRMPAGDEGRRAVPQGRHCHALLPRGVEALDTLLPGIVDELIEAGAPTYEAMSDFRFSVAGHEIARVALGAGGVTASRPFVESHLRRRVSALPEVRLRERTDAVGLTASGDRVTGARLLGRDAGSAEEAIPADLVVAATGRSGRVEAWLEDLGYGRPPAESLPVDVGYSSRTYRLEPGALADAMILIGARPGRPRGMALFAQEGGRRLLTLSGYGEHRPPSEPEAFEAFLETVAPADVLAALRAGEPLEDPVAYRFPANHRRRYERMRRFPAGLLPLGDAICSFNPLYGQGMTVAALEAEALRSCLAKGTRQLERRYLRAASAVVEHAWQMAVGGDLSLPEIEGERPLPVRLVNAYVGRLLARAERDPEAAAAFMHAAGMLAPPRSMMRPRVARRVLLGGGTRQQAWPGRPHPTPLRRRKLRLGAASTPLREAGPEGAAEAVVFCHGVPGSGGDFEPLVAAVGARGGRGLAWDAPGLGRSSAPGFRQGVAEQAGFLDAALAELGVERAHLVLHDFGGPSGLAWAAAHPERVGSVTLLGTGIMPGYRWHALARIWRAPLLGEAFMATATRGGFGALLRRGQRRPLPGPFLDRMFADFDRGTRRAVLDLYRSVADPGAPAAELAAALRPAAIPALVIWGGRDPYLPAWLAERQRDAFPEAEAHVLEEAGHWTFVDEPERVEGLLLGHLSRSGALPSRAAGAIARLGA